MFSEIPPSSEIETPKSFPQSEEKAALGTSDTLKIYTWLGLFYFSFFGKTRSWVVPNTLVVGPQKARKQAGRKDEKRGKRKGGREGEEGREGGKREGKKGDRKTTGL